jgi:hypothetical protein
VILPKAAESNDGSLPLYSLHATKGPSVRETLVRSYEALTVGWLVYVLGLSQSAVYYKVYLA